MTPRLAERPLDSLSDRRLIALAQDGHEPASTAIVERYRRELHAQARRLRSDGRGEDLVQQTFLNAFAALRSGAEVRHLRGWLHQILRNAATATPHRELSLELDARLPARDSVEDAVAGRLLATELMEGIAALPERQRQVLLAGVLHGESRAAVAQSLGLSEGAVRQLTHRARMTLRKALAAISPWPLLRWFGLGHGGAADRAVELATDPGSSAIGGFALKLGALASGAALATGIVVPQLTHGSHPAPHPPRPATREARAGAATGATARAAPLEPARLGAGGGGVTGRTGPSAGSPSEAARGTGGAPARGDGSRDPRGHGSRDPGDGGRGGGSASDSGSSTNFAGGSGTDASPTSGSGSGSSPASAPSRGGSGADSGGSQSPSSGRGGGQGSSDGDGVSEAQTESARSGRSPGGSTGGGGSGDAAGSVPTASPTPTPDSESESESEAAPAPAAASVSNSAELAESPGGGPASASGSSASSSRLGSGGSSDSGSGSRSGADSARHTGGGPQ